MSKTSRNTKAVSASEAFDSFLNAYNLKTKFNETFLITYWEKIVGATIATRTEKIYINKETLFLRISSAALRQDLVLSKTRLIDLLNTEAGSIIVKDIVFV